MGAKLLDEIRHDAQALWRARGILKTLARRELAARYAGTAAGWSWAFAQPLLTVAAYYVVFDLVFAMRLGDTAPTRAVGLYLIVGMLPWMAFSDAVSRGMNSLVEAGSLLQKNRLPFALFPVRSVAASAVVHIPLMLVIAAFYTPLHKFQWPVTALLPVMVAQWLLTSLLAYLLALFAAALRDTVQVVGFMLSLGVFLSPVLFPIEMFPADWRWVLWLNPMSALVQGYQSILLQGAWPPVQTWWITALWVLVVIFMLNRVLRRSRDQLIDWL